MPPTEKFSREAVAAAAFALARKQGISKLTARNVARKLGSSTAPVYNHFNSMEALTAEVMGRAHDLMLEYTSREYSDMRFKNMGTGYVAFAREEKELFRAMFLEQGLPKGRLEEMLNFYKEEMAKDPILTPLNDEEKYDLLQKMRSFTHGLATLIWAGLVEKNSDQDIMDALTEVGAVVIDAALAKYQS